MPLPASLTPAQKGALDAVLRSRDPAGAMMYHYRLGGVDLTPYVTEAEWGRQGADQPAITFTGKFKTSLHESLKSERLVVNLEVKTLEGPLLFRRFTGEVDEMIVRRGFTTIEAQSGGYWLDKIRFDEDGVSYVDVAPSDIIWDVVTRAAASGVYDLGFTNIETVDSPKVRREEFLTITKVDKLARPLDAAVEEAELFFRDSPYNAPVCSKDRGPAEAQDVMQEYIVGVHIDPEVFEPATTSDEYYDVIAYRTNDAGDIEYLFDPILIPNSNAPKGVGYEISVSDLSETSVEDAFAQAQKAASRLIHGESTATLPVAWPHPLMVDGDFISVIEPFDEGGRRGTRYWIAEVETNTERSDKTVEIAVTMVRRREDEEALPVVSALPRAKIRGA